MAMKIETREVLAGAYKGRTRSLLTHAVLVDSRGCDSAVLCRRVSLDSLADCYASDPAAPVTCKSCLSALKRVQVGK